MRLLRYGEKKKIIELRFGKLGSVVEDGMSFSEISKLLFIRRRTVQSVCRRYKERNGVLLVNKTEQVKYKDKISKR